MQLRAHQHSDLMVQPFDKHSMAMVKAARVVHEMKLKGPKVRSIDQNIVDKVEPRVDWFDTRSRVTKHHMQAAGSDHAMRTHFL